MDEKLEVEGYFLVEGNSITLSEHGKNSTEKILKKYSGGQIKEIAGVSRSALINYVSRANRISKRGQEALNKLISRYNSDLCGSETEDVESGVRHNIKLFSDRELLEELKNRGFNVFVSI